MLLEFRLLNLVHALEAYHRRRPRPEPDVASKDQQRKERVLAAASPEDREWLARNLQYAAQPKLKDRLADIYEVLPSSVQECNRE